MRSKGWWSSSRSRVRPVGAVGACVSGQAAVDALIVDIADLLPAASKASTPSV